MKAEATSWPYAGRTCTLFWLPASEMTELNLDSTLTSLISYSSVSFEASVSRSKSPALRSMLHALACTYWRYGPLFPSKLRASFHVKTNCFSGWTRTTLYLMAPTPMTRAISRILSSLMSSRLLPISSYARSTASSIRSSR